MLCRGRRVLITQNTLSPHADSLHSHAGDYNSEHLCTHKDYWHITNTHMHTHNNPAKLYLFHLNCRAHSPSCSTGAQTTDIILIAHHSQVVSPHSHPDSLCAEILTTENSGLTVSGGLRTAARVCCVSPKSIFLSSLQLPC